VTTDAICYDDEDLQPEPENYPTKQINFGKRFSEADPDPYPIPVLNEGYKSWNKKSKEKHRLLFTRMGRSGADRELPPGLQLWLRNYRNLMKQQML